ncbi:unnamed protein product [Schistocephalus solidus]|uniref:Acetylcholine receptor subunit beta-type unc-29 n=1 Tax=Schistocephalus solidus TaxID=70667 RepID=A0A183SEH0_SCHSO|nr:unnamed protein product [Schistocephalus solidus]
MLSTPSRKRYAFEQEIELVNYLFTKQGYNPLIRPVANLTDTVRVDLGLCMIQLIQVVWNDYQLVWDPAKYGGLKILRLPHNRVWKPDIVLFNNADGNYEVMWQPNVLVHYDGSILWMPPAIYESSCTIDVEYFPFDEQECEMKFGSWTYDASQVTLGWYSGQEFADLSDYWKSGTWDLVDVPGRIVNTSNSGKNATYIIYKIKLRRKTLFYTVNLILPCVMISLLSICVFYLPSDAGEKVTLSISIVVALIVFLILVSKILPPTSTSIPLISRYLLFTFLFDVFAVFISVVIVNWNYRTPRTHTMQPWARLVFLRILPRLLLMKPLQPLRAAFADYSHHNENIIHKNQSFDQACDLSSSRQYPSLDAAVTLNAQLRAESSSFAETTSIQNNADAFEQSFREPGMLPFLFSSSESDAMISNPCASNSSNSSSCCGGFEVTARSPSHSSLLELPHQDLRSRLILTPCRSGDSNFCIMGKSGKSSAHTIEFDLLPSATSDSHQSHSYENLKSSCLTASDYDSSETERDPADEDKEEYVYAMSAECCSNKNAMSAASYTGGSSICNSGDFLDAYARPRKGPRILGYDNKYTRSHIGATTRNTAPMPLLRRSCTAVTGVKIKPRNTILLSHVPTDVRGVKREHIEIVPLDESPRRIGKKRAKAIRKSNSTSSQELSKSTRMLLNGSNPRDYPWNGQPRPREEPLTFSQSVRKLRASTAEHPNVRINHPFTETTNISRNGSFYAKHLRAASTEEIPPKMEMSNLGIGLVAINYISKTLDADCEYRTVSS